MSEEDLRKQEIEEEKQKIIETMKSLRKKREQEILESGLDIKIIDVQYLGKIKWVEEIEGENTEKQKDIYRIIEERDGKFSYKYYDEDMEMIAAKRQEDEQMLPDEKYLDKEDKSFLKDIEELGEEKESLKEIEEKDEKSKEESEEKDEVKKQKPKYVIQTVDVDKAYVDNWTTVRKGFKIPPGVEEIAIAYPTQKDENVLSSHITMHMLDKNGYVIQEADGKTIKDLFEIDDSTGSNPMYDDNTKLELEGYAEKNKGQTMGRFQSKQNSELYLSAEQKEVGDYAQVYAGRKTRDGNDPVEVQLETSNTDIQTSLEMQQIISGYKGMYNKENIDKEADFHESHGDDMEKIAIENADGDRRTVKACDEDLIPGTDITWREFANKCGYRGKDGIERAQEKFVESKEDNPDITNEELVNKIVDDLEDDMPGFKKR